MSNELAFYGELLGKIKNRIHRAQTDPTIFATACCKNLTRGQLRMNTDKRNPKAIASSASDQTFDALLEQVRGLVQSARKTAATAINSLQVMTSFEIGRMIVEHEQQGAQRAEYGKLMLKTLSDRLTAEFGRGFSKSNLEYMRRFFLEYRNRSEQIAQMASGQSAAVFPLIEWAREEGEE